MNRRRFCFALGACVSSPFINHNIVAASPGSTYHRVGKGFGSVIRLAIHHPRRAAAEQAFDRAFLELERIESLMSVYRADSQLSALNQNGILNAPDPQLIEILRQSGEFYNKTDGAFDITVQPLWELYRKTQKQNRLPDRQQIDAVRTAIGFDNLHIGNSVRLRNSARITLNGIAQGYATDCVRNILLDRNIEHALLDVGELASLGQRSGERAWRAGIQHPRSANDYSAVVNLDGRCLATSGDYQTHFTDDFRCHHIFDPSTGFSPTELASVSVLSPSAATADALSTACMVAGVEQSVAILKKFDNVDAQFIRKDGSTVVTSGFPTGASG